MVVHKCFLAVIFFLGAVVVNADTTITKEQVENMISKMEAAALSHDVTLLTENISEHVKITLEMPSNMGGKVEFGLNEYIAVLKEGWAVPAKFTYEVKDVEIMMAADGMSATVTDTTLETMEVDGKLIMSSETAERIEIISEKGKPTITNIYGKLKI